MDADRWRRAIAAMLSPIWRRLDYLALYPAEVLQDHGDNHLDLRPDDERLPELVRVPMETFLPGVAAEVAKGSRVLLGFAGGDPSKPRARLWEAGSLVRLTIAAETAVTVQAETATVETTTATVTGQKVEVHGGHVDVDGDLITLAGGGPPVARVGDQVATPVGPGTIMQGSTKVLCG